MYIIRRTDGGRRGKYVNQPGSKHAYTNMRDRARQFPTKEEAQKDCCGNETPERY